MKRCLTRAGSRTICLGLAALAALSWSCTKEPSLDGGTGPQAEGAIAQARSFYESTVTPLTKSVGEQTITLCSLPYLTDGSESPAEKPPTDRTD